jgi:1-acyl-sn-glycerol-3-phosphate acyltransferase
MADHELFDDSWVGKMLRFLGAFPVVRGASDRNAIRTSLEILKAGDAVGICPEGQMSKDGKLLPLLPGFTLLHRKTGATLICLGLKNTNLIRPYVEPKVTRRAGKWVEANWGEPRTFPVDTPPDQILAWVQSELVRLPNWSA